MQRPKNLGEYHDLYLKSNTLFLADVFENFKKISLEIYQLDSTKFISAPALAWQAALKKDWSKIRINNWYWYAINGWKGIRGGIYHSINRSANANNNIWQIMIRMKNRHILITGM